MGDREGASMVMWWLRTQRTSVRMGWLSVQETCHPTPLFPVPTGLQKKIDVSNIVVSKGNKLVIRGAYITDTTTHDPVHLIKASIDQLSWASPLLESILVIVVPYSDQFPNSSVAYLALHPSIASLDPKAEPRCDLLKQWKTDLQNAHPTWEVAWASMMEGTDCRMRRRFPTLVGELTRKLDREPTKDKTVKCLQEILKANMVSVERVFALGTNGAAAILIHPRQVDTLHRQCQISSHSFLPDPIQVDRVTQINIQYPFELDHECFQKSFAKYQLTPPEMVFSLNDGVVPWKVKNSVVEGAEKVGGKIDMLTCRFEKIEQDIGVRLDATHALITDLKNNSIHFTEQVMNLVIVQQNTNLALITMQKELTLMRLCAPLNTAESSLRIMAMLGATEDEKVMARKNIEILKGEKALIDDQIDMLQGTKLAIAAPPPPPRTPPGLPVTPTHPTQRRTTTPPPSDHQEALHPPPETPVADKLEVAGITLSHQDMVMGDTSVLCSRDAIDVALQATSGKAYNHQIFTIYALWDPGMDNTRAFWPALMELLCNTTTSWSLGGDLNATVMATERASGGSDMRDKFKVFLDAVDGHDLWTGGPDQNRYYNWISSSQDTEKNGGSIINHFITSKATLLDVEIYVTNSRKDFIPNTNHRAVIASIIHRPPEGGNTAVHWHQDSHNLNAEQAYGRVTRFRKQDEIISYLRIQQALAEV
ncbi:hypothetical protein B0H10DRAFT_1941748 [Mycena sp. CBHHK59/15]|nr:hypothetical protein B0H10DRAFT_1941748 [Mycena sp. CBHHK59/15]